MIESVERERERLTATIAGREGGGGRMWWNKRSEDVRYCKSAVVYFICLFQNVNVIPHIRHRALRLLLLLPLWCQCLFSPASFSIHSNNNTGIRERNKQTGRKHGQKYCTALQKQSKKQEVKHWKKGTLKVE